MADSNAQARLVGRLAQRLIAELFQISIPTVNEHLTGIYEDGELDREATIRNFRIVQTEGSREVSRARLVGWMAVRRTLAAAGSSNAIDG